MKKNNEEYIIVTTCPFCRHAHEIPVNENDYWDWVDGALIQDAFPYLSADQREMLISGICPKCWDNMFGANFEEEEEDDCFEPGRPFVSMFELNP